MTKYSVALLLLLATLFSCQRKSDNAEVSVAENKQAKGMMQGVWIDAETEEVSFRVKGDTVFFPDSTSQPAYFRIVRDTLLIGEPAVKYFIVKQAEYLFWFVNSAGDTVRLIKSEEEADSVGFEVKRPEVLTVSNVVKSDTVVNYDGERYHCYVAINPTRNKVIVNTFNDDGVEVSNVYYDNMIRLSVFKGSGQRFFSRDMRKQQFAAYVPEPFLSKAVLNDISYVETDDKGLHFHATLCTPNAASCYLVEIIVSTSGEMSMQLLGS
jgi:hypothetical protein